MSIPKKGEKNSVVKKIVGDYVVTERYYGENGIVYLDIDYTCHGNMNSHPNVPHIHTWGYNLYGVYVRNGQEVLK